MRQSSSADSAVSCHVEQPEVQAAAFLVGTTGMSINLFVLIPIESVFDARQRQRLCLLN